VEKEKVGFLLKYASSRVEFFRAEVQQLTRRLNAPFFGKRYIGDSDTKILHDLDKETPNCAVEAIPRTRIQMFEWLNIPSDLMYSGCKYCMPTFKGSTPDKK
jgi:hypothetical protein